MAELRSISSRAEISPTRFWNEYQWGALKADPAKLVTRYFDAHLYFANWGSRRLILRIPAARLAVAELRPYLVRHVSSAPVARAHVVLDVHSEPGRCGRRGPRRRLVPAVAAAYAATMEIRLDVPDDLAAALQRTPEELAYDLRFRALAGLVERGLLSSGRAAALVLYLYELR